jgi:hypothetical protein
MSPKLGRLVVVEELKANIFMRLYHQYAFGYKICQLNCLMRARVADL